MVGAGLERSRSRTGVDYGSANDLFRVRLHMAQSRTDRARPIAAIKFRASAEGNEKCERGENRNPLSNCKRIPGVFDAQMVMTREERHRSQDVVCWQQFVIRLNAPWQSNSSPRRRECVCDQQNGRLFDISFNFQRVS